MLIHLARAEGSPSATVVIDARDLPRSEEELTPFLRELHVKIHEQQTELISKYALIRPSTHPMFDIDYRFVQMVPGVTPTFDFRGSCGHSILASVSVASKWGWTPNLAPGVRVRVRVENNDDNLVCEIDEANRSSVSYTAHFIQPVGTRLGSLLLTGSPVTILQTPFGEVETSLVSAGNPYVFVDATALGMTSSAELFGAGVATYTKLQAIRTAAAEHLGWDPRSVFPKIAAVGAFDRNALTVRAISVPSWHPTLALTGVACLSVAAAIEDTVVARVCQQASCTPARLTICTPGGTTAAACATTGGKPDDVLHYISVSNKRVHLISPVLQSVRISMESEVPQWA